MVNWEVYHGTANEWDNHLKALPFFSMYQSYEWGEIKKEDGWNVTRFISKSPNISMAQILYKRLPLKGAFFWCPGGILGETQTLDFDKLKKEIEITYFYFRCSFHQPDLNNLESLGWKRPSYLINSNQSMAIQLDRPEDEILKEMSSNWRHNLKRFEKKQVKVEQWIDPSPEQLYKYYETFESLKKLGKQHSFSSIKGVIERFKKNLVILRALDEEGNLLALRGYLFIGSRALDWYAISTELGRNCYASYGVLWHILKDAKSKGVTYYDLSGVDPINNAGVYNYKKGTGAKLVEYPGEFEVANFPFISLGMNILMKKKLKAE